MDEWKAEMGRVREDKRKEGEKVGKSRNTVFFQWFVALEGRKVGSLKRRVRSQLARREIKNCTPLWHKAHVQVKMYKTPQLRGTFRSWDAEKVHAGHEAHFEVKMYKTHQARTTFGSWDDEKVHGVVARSTFRSQHVQNTSASEHFRSCDVEKAHTVVARSTFRGQNVENTTCSDHFWTFRCRFAWQAQGIVQKWAKREGFVAFPKMMAGVGHLKRICKDAFSVAGAVQETCSSELLGGPISWERLHFGASDHDFAWQVRHFVWPGITCSCQAQYFRQVEWKNRKTMQNAVVRGRQLCTQLSIFEGSLAELLRFWCCQLWKMRMSRRIAACCQVQKLRKSRRIASFSSLQIDR